MEDLFPKDPKDIVPTWVRKAAEAEGVPVNLDDPIFLAWFNRMNQEYGQGQNSDDNTADS